ncbi:unnamed protein product, partial [Hapterophycus canaliculatus]
GHYPWFQVLERMKTIGEEPGGLKPDLHCLSAAIDAAGGAGEWEAALRLLDEMRSAGIKPDGFVYRQEGSGVCAVTRWYPETFFCFVFLASKVAETHLLKAQGCMFSESALVGGGSGLSVFVLRKVGFPSDVHQPGCSFLTSHGTLRVLRAAITACGNGGKLAMALRLLRDMKDDPNVPVDVPSYNAAITACGR